MGRSNKQITKGVLEIELVDHRLGIDLYLVALDDVPESLVAYYVKVSSKKDFIHKRNFFWCRWEASITKELTGMGIDPFFI